MLEQYKSLIEQKQTELKQQREAAFQEYATQTRGMIINKIWDTFPIFYSLFEEEMVEAPAVWFNCDSRPVDSKYGMPGILFRNHIFIGLRRDSDQYRIYLGSWSSQDDYTNDFHVERGFACQPFVEFEKIDQRRADLEQSFFKGIESCISLITARGNQSSFSNWRG